MVVVSLGTKGFSWDWKEGGNPIKPPPPGLEPIGDSGWYKSPEGLLPGDRDYCEYNSMSPVCGGNPFTTTGLELSAELNVDPCGFSARIGGSIAFVKMPETVISYRKAGECRREPEPMPPPSVPEGFPFRGGSPPATGFERSIGSDEVVYAGIQWTDGGGSYATCNYGDEPFKIWSAQTTTGVFLQYSDHILDESPVLIRASVEAYYKTVNLDPNIDAMCGREGGDNYRKIPEAGYAYFSLNDPTAYELTFNRLGYLYELRSLGGTVLEYHPAVQPPYYTIYTSGVINGYGSGEIAYGKWSDIQRYYQSEQRRIPALERENNYLAIHCFDVLRPNRDPNPYKRNPPPPLPPPRNCDCMQCCVSSPQNQSQQNNDALLRQILAEVQKANKNIDKINKSIGSDNLPTILPTKILGETTGFFRANNLVQVLEKQVDYVDETAKQIVADIKKANDSIGSEVLPLQFPASIKPDNTSQITLHNTVEILNQLHLYIAEINQEDVDLDKIKEVLGVDEFPAQLPARLTSGNDVVEIKNIPQLLKQQILYTDETTGEYPVKVKIEDTDPTEEGNQSEELEFANASELMAEVFGTLMNVAIDANVLVQLVTKALMEVGLTRKQLHTTQSQVDALIKHQGFEIKEKIEAVPFTFTVPQTTNLDEFKLEDFCKESIQKIEIIEYKGKNTYIEDATIIRHMHGIIKGVFFRGIAKDAASVAGEISKLLKKQGEAIDKISDNSVDDLENFIEDFERGFSSYTGGTQTNDPNKPYGLPYEQRPRVKIIKKPTTDNPGAGQ